jgi:hypothetical protein
MKIFVVEDVSGFYCVSPSVADNDAFVMSDGVGRE